jgi:acetolactate synthase-1/2/3 large subunit
MIKLSDYIIQRLREWDVTQVFMVTGGGAMHLNDSIGKPGGLRYVCTHHEQAAAIAAEGYSRVSGRPGVVCVTSGPGGTNAITGVLGAWTDSIPMLVLSGQVKRETCIATYPGCTLRQLGDQEADIIPVVRTITKYSKFVDDPETGYATS